MPNAKPNSLPLLSLRLAAALCLAGWTFQHFYWEGPYGVLFWQSSYDLAQGLGGDWDDFVGTGRDDGLVQRAVALMAWPFLLCTWFAVAARRHTRVSFTILSLGSCQLALLAYAKYVADLRQLPTLVEHGAQVLSPLLLALALAVGARHRVVVALAIIALTTTFLGHGVFALGMWQTPASFCGMTTVLFGCDHDTTTALLRVFGSIDIGICIGILVPSVRVPCALYAALWGLLTALARPCAGMSTDLIHFGADQWVHEAVVRAPHCLIPLYLFFHWRQPNRDATITS